MDKLAIAPVVVLLITGLGMQLFDLAEAASEKTISFSEEAVSAVDCAFLGIELSHCSAQFDYDFERDIGEFEDLLTNSTK